MIEYLYMDSEDKQFNQLDNQKAFLTNPKNKNHLTKWIIISSLVLIALIGGYFIYQYYFNQEQPVACSEDTKVCPDGSTVSRIPPDCEFAECPETDKDLTVADWKIYRNVELEIEFRYPKDCEITRVSSDSILIENNEGFQINFSMPPLGGGYCIENKENIIINNDIEAIKNTCVDFNDFLNLEQRQVVINFSKEKSDIKEDALLVILHKNPDDISSNDFLNLANSIISSFKFTEFNQTQDWKTYRNEELGIEFRYPKHGLTNKEIYIIDDTNRLDYCEDGEKSGYCANNSVNLCIGNFPFCHKIKRYDKKIDESPEEAFNRVYVRPSFPNSECEFEIEDKNIFLSDLNIKLYSPKNTEECQKAIMLFNGYMYFVYDENIPDAVFHIGIGHDTIFNPGSDEHQLWLDSINFFR